MGETEIKAYNSPSADDLFQLDSTSEKLPTAKAWLRLVPITATSPLEVPFGQSEGPDFIFIGGSVARNSVCSGKPKQRGDP